MRITRTAHPRKIVRLIATVATTLAMITVSLTPATAATSADASALRLWSRCNDIAGSPLCITVNGNLNDTANVTVSYRKNSGPVRSARLYLARCGKAKELVHQGSVRPGQTIYGSKIKYIYFNSCWVGYLRIGNTQWTTGELLTR
jgi:hypothetical protein